jgi:hypothetical protein
MARLELINTGVSPNDGTGDTIRDAFKKINSNFELLSEILELDFDKVQPSGWPKREDYEKINSNFKKIMNKFNENSTN